MLEPRGKWDRLRECIIEKGIPFLGLFSLRGKRFGGLG
jgi:hypothetical protein